MITKIIKRLRKKIKANRHDIDMIISRLASIQQDQQNIATQLERHIAFHVDRELERIDTNVMCR